MFNYMLIVINHKVLKDNNTLNNSNVYYVHICVYV